MTLEIVDLSVDVDSKPVLRDINLRAEKGKLTVIMGPNGSGKTSLAYTIMGHPNYKVVKGKIFLEGEDITDKTPDERANKGLFLVFQNPIEVPGINLLSLLTAVLNKKRGKADLTEPILDLRKKLVVEAGMIGLKEELLERELNIGFSGGEKKRSELLQVKILRPKYVIMDEPDSGLDVDGVRIVADVIREMLSTGSSIILITHYPRVLQYIDPHKVVVLYKGRIVATGKKELVEKIDREGYKWLGDQK
ncbi:Fe-S cluster assembly ATPase SufC [Staphylothermus hellenicus]|uniref:FeS assembly ATPase SufC n=1 Tax=Staphylothermus hellenicus (strain DSM 12710 / JCM 10830 / BK20S6-10-b1 / P8) TaxID=591019 RepID=D7DCC5_STAHD|nr:Fe-S cluster assembly ATPase SufC [Staphylothermus hellenicus]ADI31822.1 FeS assembly ATPase SufC [Staphylothermus hellenicus DSM 12710]